VESAEAALETAQLNLEYCYIHSPIQGRARGRGWSMSETSYRPTRPGLLLIQRLDPIYADFTITEARPPPTCRRRWLAGTLKTFVRLPSDPEDRAHGGQTHISRQHRPETAPARSICAPPSPTPIIIFWPGQFVNVRLVLATQKKVRC